MEKVEAIWNWPPPINKKTVRAILRNSSYSRLFISKFASLTVPLTNLTKGKESVVIKWSPEAEKAFESFKTGFVRTTVLYSPEFAKDIVIQTDASEAGLGTVLSQV